MLLFPILFHVVFSTKETTYWVMTAEGSMDTRREASRPRFIDTIESPQDVTQMKVIVLGASR